MKRYDLMVHEEKDGTVHANMEEDVDGMYVTRHDAEQAIAAAVLAERRRIWDEFVWFQDSYVESISHAIYTGKANYPPWDENDVKRFGRNPTDEQHQDDPAG